MVPKRFPTCVSAEVQGAAIHRHNRNYVMGFLRAAGEEVGWRCFLLPCLLDVYNYRYDQALVISLKRNNCSIASGLVWGLFHVPVMALLTRLKRPDQPYATVTVQCLSCLLAAFPHGWVAIKTGHSLWGASVMHWFWNIYNPRTLGSIYTNTPGRYCGPQWKINGEGLAGCIVLAPVAILVCWELANPIF
ncbi:hypothetical protein MAR_027392 [Mya arenaria]|uniref:CAAX prenyl protease 2/Lysostaphin resistance protein A-like domain-containing protein n=1 Tax=Mya arenaria TaxID=6604 RepID=A0ABY7EWD8_MYAAR|nr:hypothetical protein MAR_027392 [Mya arenaria]